MEIQELITFTTIVQQGSFSKASQKLGYCQGAVTIHIKNLEKELGVQLFDRLGKKITLTNHGKTFYTHCIKILDDIASAKEAIHPELELNGHLTIGTIDSLCSSIVPPLISHYQHLYPHVSISITTDSIDGLLHMLKNNDIDFAYLVDRQLSDLDWLKIFEVKEKVTFVASKNHPITQIKNPTIQDILSFPIILTEKDASYRQLLEERLHQQHLEIKPFIQSKNTDLILELLRKNQYISFLPEYILKDDLSNQTLIQLDIPEYYIEVYRQLICHKDKWISNEMKAFFQLIKEDNNQK